MRVVFFGSGEFGVPSLQALVESGNEVTAVVTQPERPAGRGARSRPTPIAHQAEAMGLPILAPEKPNTPKFEKTLRNLVPELAVVIAYGHLIKPPLRGIPRDGCGNLPAALLPAYRGAAPVPWAIIGGETVSGVSVFQLDERFDTGAVIGMAELPIAPDDTSGSYLRKLAPLGAELLVTVVRAIAAGTAVPQPQDDRRASRAPKFRKQDGRLDWNRPFAELERLVRGLQPWPQAHTRLVTSKGTIRTNVIAMCPADHGPAPLPPGTVLAADARSGLVVMTGDVPARLCCVQPEGRRAMTDTDFLRGTAVEAVE
ncbi:MAG: methionyl-tRNA formyltransferase [Planctomycetes bacterium]|nr:methionyl-tRNA formyltransferase [Planctomycetota bacterium]